MGYYLMGGQSMLFAVSASSDLMATGRAAQERECTLATATSVQRHGPSFAAPLQNESLTLLQLGEKVKPRCEPSICILTPLQVSRKLPVKVAYQRALKSSRINTVYVRCSYAGIEN